MPINDVRRSFARGVLVATLMALSGCPAEQPAPVLTAGVSAEEHADAFPIAGASNHRIGAYSVEGAIDCGSCHDGGATFAVFFCQRCHDHESVPLATRHGLVSGYDAADTACLVCHPTGERGSVIGAPPSDGGPNDDAHPRFPVVTGSAHGSDSAVYLARADAAGLSYCQACHASTSDTTQVRCADCHADDSAPDLDDAHPLGVVRNGYDDVPRCQQCHWQIPIPERMHPMSNHAAVLDGAWDHPYVTRCSDCHQQVGTDTLDFAYDFASTLCTDCHVPACSADALTECH